MHGQDKVKQPAVSKRTASWLVSQETALKSSGWTISTMAQVAQTSELPLRDIQDQPSRSHWWCRRSLHCIWSLQEASQKLEPKKKEHLSRKPHRAENQEHECLASSIVSTLKDCRCAHAPFISSYQAPPRTADESDHVLIILCDSVFSDDLNMSHMVKNLIGRFMCAGKRPFIIRKAHNHF